MKLFACDCYCERLPVNVTPVKGTVSGGGAHQLSVAVDVTRVD